jgi:transcriptional regulator with XRE-family HTH domain
MIRHAHVCSLNALLMPTIVDIPWLSQSKCGDCLSLTLPTIVVMDWKKTLGENIQKARLDLPGGMTQKQLADAAGLVRNSIVNYENGKRAPDFEILRKIASVLNQDHFDASDNMRIEFSSNGQPHPVPLPEQLNLVFDEKKGVNVRIESTAQGVIIKKISA